MLGLRAKSGEADWGLELVQPPGPDGRWLGRDTGYPRPWQKKIAGFGVQLSLLPLLRVNFLLPHADSLAFLSLFPGPRSDVQHHVTGPLLL